MIQYVRRLELGLSMFLLSSALLPLLPLTSPWYQAPSQSLSLSLTRALPPSPFVAPRDQNSGAAKTPLLPHLCVVLLALRTVNSP